MGFQDSAAKETITLITSLRSAWSGQPLQELQTLRRALEAAVLAAETALIDRAEIDHDGAIGAVVERLAAAAQSEAENAALQASTAAQTAIDTLQRELRERCAQETQIVAALEKAREQAEALRSALDGERALAATARADLAHANEAHARAETARQCVEAAARKASREHDAACGQLEELRHVLDATRAHCEELAAQLQASEAQCRGLTEDLDATTARARALERAQAEQVQLYGDLQARFDAATVEARTARHAAGQATLEREHATADARARLEQASALHATTQSQLEAERATTATLRDAVETARQRVQAIRTAARAGIRASRAAREAELRQDQVARATLASALATAQHEISATRDEANARAASLTAAEARLQALETACAEMQRARDEAEARIADHIRGQTALTEALREARHAASAARSEAKPCGNQLQDAIQQIRTVEKACEGSVAKALVRSLPDHRDEGLIGEAPLDRAPATQEESVRLQNDPDVTGLGPADLPPVTAASLGFPGPARGACRVNMPERTKVLVDGSAGVLVNLSSLGAQIRSERVLRPNHSVRILLSKDNADLQCKGRVVWAWFELSEPHGTPGYRAGVKFTEANASALQAFLIEKGLVTGDS